MILSFPTISESKDFHSSLACLKGMMLYYGVTVPNYEEIIKGLISPLHKDEYTSNIDLISKKFGFTMKMKGWSIDGLIDNVVHKIPTMIHLQSWAKHGGVDYTDTFNNSRFSVVIGFEDDHIIFSDPCCCYRTFLTHEELMRRWHAKENDSVYNLNMGIVLEGKNPSFDFSEIKHMN